jgi:hypothetical protein
VTGGFMPRLRIGHKPRLSLALTVAPVVLGAVFAACSLRTL